MPYCCARLHEVLRELVLADPISSCSAIASKQELRAEGLLARLGDLGAVHVVLEAVLALEVAVHLVVDELLRDRDSTCVEQRVGDLVAGLDDLLERASACSTCSRTSARSSSRVSNSLAICAKSSSSSGSSRSLTARTVTAICASSPSWSPPSSVRLEGGRLAGGERCRAPRRCPRSARRSRARRRCRWRCRPPRRRWWRRGRSARSRRSWPGGRR